jgi:hypothetical protein
MLEQMTDEWHASKKYKISGSTCYSFYTYGTKCKNWKEKALTLVFKKKLNHPNLQHGILNEPKALKKYIKDTNYLVLNFGLITHLLHPWLVFSPDGVVFIHGVPYKLIEIKCPVKGKQMPICEELLSSCKFLVKQHKSQDWELKRKHSYYAQVQLGMAIMNLDTCDFILYAPFDDSIKIIPVKRNNIFISELLRTLKDKYFNYVLPHMCHQ